MTEIEIINGHKFFSFIQGETIDLCVPNVDESVIEVWSQWFNNSETTRYLDQGVFPNSIDDQKAFLELTRRKKDRLLLLIRPKGANYYAGVASLSFINFETRGCGIAHVIGKRVDDIDSLFYSLEAKCRLTEHAFEKLGMQRIESGQAVDLKEWQRIQTLFGYRVEGIKRNYFRKGQYVADCVVTSCIFEDYLRLKKKRGGNLWPGKNKLFKMIKKLPAESTYDRLEKWMSQEYQNIEELVLSLSE